MACERMPPPMAAPVTGAKAALSVATVLSSCCALCLQPISGPHSDTASLVMQDGVSHSGADVLHVVCGNLVRRSAVSQQQLVFAASREMHCECARGKLQTTE